jgi:hypothetical protein
MRTALDRAARKHSEAIMQFAARISRVRMKNGADVTILPTPMDHGDPEEPENYRGAALIAAKRIAQYDEPESKLDGFIVLGFYSDGTTSMGMRIPQRLPRPLLPAYIAEIIRRDAITEKEAADTFDRMFQWVE